MISPSVPKVFPTSGTAIRIAVEEMGARKAQYEMIEMIVILRAGEKRLYCSEFSSSDSSVTWGRSWLVRLLGTCTSVLGVPGGSPYSDRGLCASSGGSCVMEEFLEHPSSAVPEGFCFDLEPKTLSIVLGQSEKMEERETRREEKRRQKGLFLGDSGWKRSLSGMFGVLRDCRSQEERKILSFNRPIHETNVNSRIIQRK